MPITFEPFDMNQADALVEWLISDEWPFHAAARPGRDRVRASVIDKRFYASDSDRTFWMVNEAGDRAGIVAFHDLQDLTPRFDLRITAAHRGKGLGKRALAWLTDYVFTDTGKHRIEAHVRADNIAMRKALQSADAWVMESFYRQCWPDGAGVLHDAVQYAALKCDWRSGQRTPIRWGKV